MAFGSGKKPANQGSMGTPNVQPVKTSGTPSPVNPGPSKILFGYNPGGTKGTGGNAGK